MMKAYKPTSAVPQLSLVEKAFLREQLKAVLTERAQHNAGDPDDYDDPAEHARRVAAFDAECAEVLAAYPELAFLEPTCLHWYWDMFCNDVWFMHWDDPVETNSFRFYLLGHLAKAPVHKAPEVDFGVQLWAWLCEGMPLPNALVKMSFTAPCYAEWNGAGIENRCIFVDVVDDAPQPAPAKKGFARILTFLVGR